MTKEKLEKEAIAKYKTGSYPQLHPDHYAFIHGYLASAEPREKRIEELENKNKELEEKLEKETAQRIYNFNKSIEWKEKHRRLEKENAELKELLNCNNCSELSEEECEVCAEYSHFKCNLKEQNKNYGQLIEKGSVTLVKERLKNHKQIIKIKELLENIIRVTWGEGWSYNLDWKVKAEQFLKEIEK